MSLVTRIFSLYQKSAYKFVLFIYLFSSLLLHRDPDFFLCFDGQCFQWNVIYAGMGAWVIRHDDDNDDAQQKNRGEWKS